MDTLVGNIFILWHIVTANNSLLGIKVCLLEILVHCDNRGKMYTVLFG
uniref:IP09425p n=1 Tax=Drosophila melanogaster TaxID=7227 RepID=Q4V436_DROME|nr:IP09425p [Drosophila melanogaster]